MSHDLPEPEFRVGDLVRVIVNEQNRTSRTGAVREVIWHHKHERYNYYLEEHGKKVSKRYYADDLKSIGNG